MKKLLIVIFLLVLLGCEKNRGNGGPVAEITGPSIPIEQSVQEDDCPIGYWGGQGGGQKICLPPHDCDYAYEWDQIAGRCLGVCGEFGYPSCRTDKCGIDQRWDYQEDGTAPHCVYTSGLPY